jgi:alpha/beta superfamily hydrolase
LDVSEKGIQGQFDPSHSHARGVRDPVVVITTPQGVKMGNFDNKRIGDCRQDSLPILTSGEVDREDAKGRKWRKY